MFNKYARSMPDRYEDHQHETPGLPGARNEIEEMNH